MHFSPSNFLNQTECFLIPQKLWVSWLSRPGFLAAKIVGVLAFSHKFHNISGGFVGNRRLVL
jgi:hypothetical protein